jgi:transcriptional regulator with XRE-family HTH domain
MINIPENANFIFCDRLRQLRKRLGLKIDDVSKETGLSFGQIQRIEGSLAKKNGETLYRGGDGRASTLIILLIFYSQRISLDMFLDFNKPVSDIPLTKKIDKVIAREQILTLIERIQEIADRIF